MTLAAEAQIFHDGYFSTRFVLFKGDCAEVLSSLESNSAASLVTDPPAGISFMGKAWDSDKGGRDAWIAWLTEIMREAHRVLKPGAHGLVWALPRTSHWTAMALEDAGFEVRDVVTHLFGSGFPKSRNLSVDMDKATGVLADRGKAFCTAGVGDRKDIQGTTGAAAFEAYEPITPEAKQWAGWGTALKPASEHWILIRKPVSEKTIAANVLAHGTGGINIDAGRIGSDARPTGLKRDGTRSQLVSEGWDRPWRHGEQRVEPNAADVTTQGRFPANVVLSHSHECGDACAPDCAVRMLDEQSGTLTSGARIQRGDDNKHPTVKSTQLMRYLIKLITPSDGIVLDPFMGSGTTGVSALPQGFRFIGIEQDETSFHTAKRRLCKTPYRG